MRIRGVLDSLIASAIWDFLKWAPIGVFPGVAKIMDLILGLGMQWRQLLFWTVMGCLCSFFAWAIQRQWGMPLVTVSWEKEFGFIRGLRFWNHGPGPAFNVTIEPIKGNGYEATLTEIIPILARDEKSEILIPRILPIGSSLPVVESDIHAVLGVESKPLIVRFVDAAGRVRRRRFEIEVDSLLGNIQVGGR